MILRIFLTKLKRLLKIKTEQEKNDDLEKILTTYKPPIFWKDKEILKQQIKLWNSNNLRYLIIKVNKIELIVKKIPQFLLFW